MSIFNRSWFQRLLGRSSQEPSNAQARWAAPPGRRRLPPRPSSKPTVWAPSGEEGERPQAGVEPEQREGYRLGQVLAELYRIEERLGYGGMGEVWKVHHLGWGIPLAMKEPRPEWLRDAQGRQAFQREREERQRTRRRKSARLPGPLTRLTGIKAWMLSIPFIENLLSSWKWEGQVSAAPWTKGSVGVVPLSVARLLLFPAVLGLIRDGTTCRVRSFFSSPGLFPSAGGDVLGPDLYATWNVTFPEWLATYHHITLAPAGQNENL